MKHCANHVVSYVLNVTVKSTFIEIKVRKYITGGDDIYLG